MRRVRVVRPPERTREEIGGRTREEAFALEEASVALVRRPGRSFSKWHHHGDHDSFAYVVAGLVRVEFGPDGEEHEEAKPGDFIHIPRRAIHREGAPTASPVELVVALVGTGPNVVEVEGPERGRA